MKLFIGIDASQKNNQCCIVDHNGNKVAEIRVSNDLSGAQKMEALIEHKASEFNVEVLKAATEASSMYDFHIIEFLSKSQILEKHGLKLCRFNPRLIKAFKPSLKIRDKTDPNDAYAIAEYLRFQSEKADEYRAKLDHLPLQRLTRFRWHLVN